ncbi:DUF4410 domain-containing protein [Acidomonas methanolica]|uniref:Uncharacterized protein n=1 Tax=Acidomonas methanolica NBRC 104435 TaxID=1231351 RepID=A0A023D6T0_ACIMT|nr:DUF4410 domain-containing protein [Acidomonas methanolica]MBU2655290.1 DUF4410 domain-containing protein [Acidomonas methanolica]GAJ29872.1 hypothetical protein Amme_083_047 [Acidomonas methanolica NBRC 104435]GBQ53351.1 hypothetical protein AA0498_1924 [Acidomonas methanolica]
MLTSLFPYSPVMTFASPEDRAAYLVGVMRDALVHDLSARGIHALPLSADAPIPSSGWLLEGRFQDVDEGNRVVRTMVGFGAGHTSLAVSSTITPLSGNPPKSLPVMTLDLAARSGQIPGALVGFNPYAAGAGYLIDGYDTKIDVQHTAQLIAKELAGKLWNRAKASTL